MFGVSWRPRLTRDLGSGIMETKAWLESKCEHGHGD